MNRSPVITRYSLIARVLHGVILVMVLTMLGVGASMLASPGWYYSLVTLHRLLGLAAFALVILQLAYRLWSPPQQLPDTMSRLQRIVVTSPEYAVYGLIFTLPIIGWGMLSAARYPVLLPGNVYLPNILPHDIGLHAVLRAMHSVFSYCLVLCILAHLGVLMFYTFVTPGGLGSRWRSRRHSPQVPKP
jgi:cytochrome b561